MCVSGEEKEEEWGEMMKGLQNALCTTGSYQVQLDHHSNRCCTILHVVHSDTCQVRGITLVISL